jgi:hypothetical protein
MSQILVTGEAKIRDIQGPVVSNSGVITALDGDASQYVRGDGTLADFPTSTGGGSSVSYYLNSSVSQGTIGGVAYRQLGKTPISGAGTDIAISTTGYVASYLTDANDPALLEVPAGNFNCEFYFSVNNNTGNPFVYAEVYKYDGTTFTLLGTSVGVPEYITEGTVINPYYFAVPVAVAALTVTDRIAIRIYVNVGGRTVTLHTENNHLCQVVTTFSKGLISLNNLTRQNQFFGTGTSGTDFAISSSVATHTFNLPVASAANTGKLSSTDWSTFNNKQATLSFTAPLVDTSNTISIPAATSLVDGYLDNADWINFNTAYNNMIVSAAVTGTTTKTLTLTQQDAGTITASWTDDNTDAVTSVFGRTGAVVATSGDYTTTQVTEGTNLYFTDSRSRLALSFVAGSGAYNSTTGVITIPTNNNQITNGAGYITSSALSAYLPLAGGTLTGALGGTTATFSGLGTFNQLTMTGATEKRLFFAQIGGVVSQSGNLNWDYNNERLGIGTPNPQRSLTIFNTIADNHLQIAGTAPSVSLTEAVSGGIYQAKFGMATAAGHYVSGSVAGDFILLSQTGATIFATNSTEKARITSGGNFLVGTGTDNGSILQIKGTKPQLIVDGNTVGCGISLTHTIVGSDRRNWGIFTEDNVFGDFVIKRSTTGGGAANTAVLSLLNTGAATFSSSVTAGANSTSNYGTINDVGIFNNAISGGTASNPAYYGGIRFTGGGYDWGAIRTIQTNPSVSWLNRLAFFTQNGTGGAALTERMCISNEGNVGIGTLTATNKLTISNNGNSAIAFRINDTNANASFLSFNASNSDAAIIAGGTAAIPFDIYTGGTTRFSIASTGAATFSSSVTATSTSTTAPSTGTGLYLGYGASTNNFNGINFQGVFTTDMYFGRAIASDDLVIRTTAGEKIRFTSAGAATFSSSVTATGNVTARSRLAITKADNTLGAIIDYDDAVNQCYIYNNKTGGYFSIYTNAVERLQIASTGAATFSSLGTGTVQATSGTLSTTSDMNLKDEDGFIDNAVEKVMNLKPRYFHWKEESGLPTDLRQLGFYAQEVNEALGEEAANTPKTENDKWGIYDRAMIAFLTKAIQELKAEIDELKALINK